MTNAHAITQAYQASQKALQKLGIHWLKTPQKMSLTVEPYTQDTFTAQTGWYQTADKVETLQTATQVQLADIQSAELKGEEGTLLIRPNLQKLYKLQKDENGEYLTFTQKHMTMNHDQTHGQASYQILYHINHTNAPKYSIFDGLTAEGGK